MSNKNKILIVDDDKGVRDSIADVLEEFGFIPITVASGKDALRELTEEIDVALIDLRLEDTSGVEVLKEIKKQSPNTECILVTGYASQESAIDAINLGAYSYILKPYDIHNLQLTIHRAIEKQRTEKELLKSEKNFRDLYNNAPDMYASISAMDASILVCNDTLLLKTGYNREELIGQHVFSIYHENSLEEAHQVFDQFKKTGSIKNKELTLKTKNGSKMHVSLNAYAVRDHQGNVLHSMSSWRDITELKQSQQEQKILKEKMQQAQKMEAIGTLAGGIAHDFNNILSSIIGFTELALGEAPEGSGLEDNLKEVFMAGQRAKELVQQILAFARQSDTEVKPIKPSAIITDALKLLRPSTPSNITISSKITSTSLTLGNESQLHQIIMNLCTNSIHAMQRSGGRLGINLINIQATTLLRKKYPNLQEDEYIKLTVTDNGTGIDSSIIQNIFDPYFTTKRVGEGTGMGLAVVKGIVDSYGGYMDVTSEPSKKTEFTVLLPICKFASTSVLPENQSDEKGDEHILLIDDEPPITRLGKRILESLGYTVTVRTSSFDALELFKIRSDQFDIVISDITMPFMTGDDLAVELRKVRETIPIILCTGYSTKINDERAKRIGIDGFLYKPFSKTDFSRVVRKALDKRKK